MISKLSIGSGFGRCLSYCLQPKKNPEILYSKMCFGGKKDITQQMNEIARLSSRVEKPVWHASLSFPLGDKIDNRKLVEIALKLEDALDIKENQYVVIKHNDTDTHDHIHIVINRVSVETGKASSTSHSFRKMVRFCREIENEYGLQKVLSPKGFLQGKEKNIPRNDVRKEDLKEIIKEGLTKFETYPELFEFIKASGYEIEKGRGITFIDSKKVRIKGSQVGFSLKTIDDTLKQNMERKLELKMNLSRNLNLKL